ncbi:hypothetical protein BOTBODRAFT_154474 [Botryobasidium botryosum FD-172 SS1]|uniref:HPP transmembrane region domain-containing protein n=1 Tax=Botryobasidium botryosum (strain FD-172 SS1) TaxID=930990 RepID=A0A067N441_BOTB1|nr:hypothetical protein BOTBODRAFT_154474 [Botryobasidium botryosum FD-172 SS1]
MSGVDARPSPGLLSRLPRTVSRFLGYRSESPIPRSKYIVLPWAFVGTFCSLAAIQAVFEHSPCFTVRNVPAIIATFGASAILLFGAIDAPFAQPRFFLGGHTVAAIIGVCVTKLFDLMPSEVVERFRWIISCLATSIALVVMNLTGTTFPPAGGTALIASSEREARKLGWYYIPVVMLSSILMLAVALLLNNVQRRYPLWWLSPRPQRPQVKDLEKDAEIGGNPAFSSATTSKECTTSKPDKSHTTTAIVIWPTHVDIPHWMTPDAHLLDLLETVKVQLAQAETETLVGGGEEQRRDSAATLCDMESALSSKVQG